MNTFVSSNNVGLWDYMNTSYNRDKGATNKNRNYV